MATRYQHHITGDTLAHSIYWLTTTNQMQGQSFTVATAHKIVHIRVKVYRVGNPGVLTAHIYKVKAGAEYPVEGTSLVSGTYNANTLTTDTNGEWITITLGGGGYNLVVGSSYAIMLSAYSGDASNKVYWRYDDVDNFANGRRLQYTAAAGWQMTASDDMMFEEWGDPTGLIERSYSKKLITIGNKEVWYEITPEIMVELLTANGDIDTDDVINATVLAQKLFITNGAIRKVFDFVNTKIVTTNIGTNPPDFGTILEGTSGAKMIVDYITHETANGQCTIYGKRITPAITFPASDPILGTNPSTSVYGVAVDFTMTAVAEVPPPHWYDYTVFGNNTDSADNFGVMPTKAYQICKYRGRIQLSGDPDYSHQWYQSRQLHPFDYLFVPGDAQSPVHGNNADCAEVGDIVKVAIPYSDDILVYGCANELWVMHGDAAFGGELNPLDTTTGILGDRAWCWDDKVNLYIMGTAGLLRIPKGFGQIENLTRELWPDFVEDLAFDSSLHRIILAFDPENFGIHIFKTTLSDGTCVGWWYDLRTEGLFPDAIPTVMGIYSAFYYQTGNPSSRKLLVGCNDGYIKSFDKATKNDDGTTITSYVGFAPLALSTHPRKDGIIKNIDIVTGIGDTDTDGVTCTVHVARTAAQIIKKLNDGDTAAFTKTFIVPNWSKSNLDRRSIRGQWGAIVLTNSVNTESWSMERLIVDTKEIGRSI